MRSGCLWISCLTLLNFSSSFKLCGWGYGTAFLNQWDLTFGWVERQVSNIKTSIKSTLYITVETHFFFAALGVHSLNNHRWDASCKRLIITVLTSLSSSELTYSQFKCMNMCAHLGLLCRMAARNLYGWTTSAL